jgi:hypothetical protein
MVGFESMTEKVAVTASVLLDKQLRRIRSEESV